MRKLFLEIIVFLCGAVVMVFEIAGSRVLGPYLGTSIFIWTSLIGIILGSLSVGYWLGGRLADRSPTYAHLAWIILAAALLILLTNIFKGSLLRFMPAMVPGLRWQSVISSIILFAPASIFLGMVSPYAVKLKIKSLDTSGRTVGNLYAISTIGSIAGTFLAGFFLIPLIGTTNILFSLAILLASLAILCFFRDRIPARAVIPAIVILFSTYSAVAYQFKTRPFIDIDTAYNRVWIYDVEDKDTEKKVRYMRINNESSSAMFLDSDSLVFPYADFYRLAEYYTPGFRSALMLGGAAFSYPKFFLEEYPEATMDVVEIDPELTRLARKHFRLKDHPRLDIFHEDARTFINRTGKQYDVIFGDLFRSQYTLPWHLTTLEAVKEYYRILSNNGSILVNIISPVEGTGSEFLAAELATFREVFPHTYVFAVNEAEESNIIQSIMLVATKASLPANQERKDLFEEFLDHEVTSFIMNGAYTLTDDHAPVDFIMSKAIK